MPFPIINSIASWFLKQRIHQIELFLKYPHEIQDELLMNLIRNCEETLIGKKHDFASIKNYRSFSERIPVSTYEEQEPMIELTRKAHKMYFGIRQLNGLPNRAEQPMPKANLYP